MARLPPVADISQCRFRPIADITNLSDLNLAQGEVNVTAWRAFLAV
jgi:hypothetical protein